jgi:hypothetical protein
MRSVSPSSLLEADRPDDRCEWKRAGGDRQSPLLVRFTADSNIENSALQSDHYGMSTAVRIEFRQNALHMGFDRAFGNRKLGGNQLIRLSGGNSLQHLDFALSQCVIDGVLRYFKSDLGGNVAPAGMYRPDGLEQLLSQHVLEEIA